jgi:hypothetical protein
VTLALISTEPRSWTSVSGKFLSKLPGERSKSGSEAGIRKLENPYSSRIFILGFPWLTLVGALHWMNCSACTRRLRRAMRSAMVNTHRCPKNPLDALQLRTHDSHRASAFEKINFDGTKLPMVAQAYWATANGRNRPFRPNLTTRNLPPFLTIMSLFGQTSLSFLH